MRPDKAPARLTDERLRQLGQLHEDDHAKWAVDARPLDVRRPYLPMSVAELRSLLAEVQGLRRVTETRMPFIGLTPACTLCSLPAHVGSCERARVAWHRWEST